MPYFQLYCNNYTTIIALWFMHGYIIIYMGCGAQISGAKVKGC